MKLSKKLLIYPLAITSLYLSPTEAYSQNYGGFSAVNTSMNTSRGHGGCKNQTYLDILQVKSQRDSLEKLMINKEEYCLDNPYKNHKCNGKVHLDTLQVKNQIESLENIMSNKEQFYDEPHKRTRLIDTTAGKIAFGTFGIFALFFIGCMIKTTVGDWNKPDMDDNLADYVHRHRNDP